MSYHLDTLKFDIGRKYRYFLYIEFVNVDDITIYRNIESISTSVEAIQLLRFGGGVGINDFRHRLKNWQRGAGQKLSKKCLRNTDMAHAWGDFLTFRRGHA